MEVTGSDKHPSLLQYGIIHGSKKLMLQALGVNFTKLYLFVTDALDK